MVIFGLCGLFSGKISVDQRDTVDVLHSKGKRLYYKATHDGLIKDRKDWLRTHPKALVGR